MRIVIDATRAIARSRPVSSRVRHCGAGRAITNRAPAGCSSSAAAAEHAPTPGTSKEHPSSPGFTASSSATGAVPRAYPIEATSWSPQTMAATSASSASAARSTAAVAAAASLSAAETAATNSASCWVDHPGVLISLDRADDATGDQRAGCTKASRDIDRADATRSMHRKQVPRHRPTCGVAGTRRVQLAGDGNGC